MSSEHTCSIEPIAHIRTPFVEKFGIPRQSGLVDEVLGTIVFEPKYRDPDALRGIETFSHLWLIWGFSETRAVGFAPVVRPPRLGGNEKLGVFATRSPYRPNGLGLSAVRFLDVVEDERNGMVLRVSGVDLLDGTPIYDIKPYIPYADAIPDATGGFAQDPDEGLLEVLVPFDIEATLGADAKAIRAILARDPRPAYQDDPQRVYGLSFGSWNVSFVVRAGILEVLRVSKL